MENSLRFYCAVLSVAVFLASCATTRTDSEGLPTSQYWTEQYVTISDASLTSCLAVGFFA